MVQIEKKIFTKPALDNRKLLYYLSSEKGLNIPDTDFANRCLDYIGYYRLKIYMRAFDQKNKKFTDGTTFNQIVAVYNFDRKLRLILSDAIERIEVSLRAQIVNSMSLIGTPHFYYNEDYFDKKTSIATIRKIGEQSNHLSIRHYKDNYHKPYLPPIWCLTEASTFGQLSTIFADLKREYRKEIARKFNLDEKICVSWFRCLSTLRNICAHHGRLWNADLLIDMPMIAKDYADEMKENKKLFSRIFIICFLLKTIDPDKDDRWAEKLSYIIDERPPDAALETLGFPAKWKEIINNIK